VGNPCAGLGAAAKEVIAARSLLPELERLALSEDESEVLDAAEEAIGKIRAAAARD
jgi:hypothetical protein